MFTPEMSMTKYGSKTIKYQGQDLWNRLMKANPKIDQSKFTYHVKYI